MLPELMNNSCSIALFRYLLKLSKDIPNLDACLRLLSLINTIPFRCLRLSKMQKANSRCVVSVDTIKKPQSALQAFEVFINAEIF